MRFADALTSGHGRDAGTGPARNSPSFLLYHLKSHKNGSIYLDVLTLSTFLMIRSAH